MKPEKWQKMLKESKSLLKEEDDYEEQQYKVKVEFVLKGDTEGGVKESDIKFYVKNYISDLQPAESLGGKKYISMSTEKTKITVSKI